MSDKEAAVYDPHLVMNTKVLMLHEQMRSLVVSRKKRHKRLPQRTKWALYEKNRFNDLIENVIDLVNVLETILPVERETQNRLCEEVSSTSPNADLLLLNDIAKEQDPVLIKAVRKALGEREEWLPSAVFSGGNNRGFQLGNNTGMISGFTFGGGGR